MRQSQKMLGVWEERPLLIFWETTRACLLKCKHCRAEALKEPLPDELGYEDALDLIDQVTEFGDPKPILILTGGDPLLRKDLWDILSYASSKKLRIAIAPSVTPLLTRSSIKKIVESGVRGVSISIDSPHPNIHDSIRGVSGTWGKTVNIVKDFIETGVHVQVNTVIMRETLSGLPAMVKFLLELGVKVWEPFYLIPVGRAWFEMDLTPNEWEDVSHFLYEASKYGIVIRTVEGPMFRRVALLRMIIESRGFNPDTILHTGELYQKLLRELRKLIGDPSGKQQAQTTGTRDGKGIIFVAHNGDVYPSGFLPLSVDNVKRNKLAKIYRENTLLRRLRSAKFKGRCGKCEFRDLCGGSRARAYSYYRDPLAEDPACPYVPGTLKSIAKKINIEELELKSSFKKLGGGIILE